jgi:protein-tyrosine-phosphatase
MSSAPPGAVLFACNLNRVRSPMAEALLKRLAGDRIFVDSCGLEAEMDDLEAGEGIDPFVAEVMSELGCDLTRHRPKTFEALEPDSFDLIITLTPEAQARALELGRGRAAEVEYWPAADPTAAEGSREARLAVYRAARDALAARISERFG